VLLSDTDIQTVKTRLADGVRVLGLRFIHDAMCPGQRFARLRQELGNGFESVEIDSGPGNPHNISRSARSVVTVDLVDEDGHPTRAALERVLAFFQVRLKESPLDQRKGPLFNTIETIDAYPGRL